MVSGVGAGSAGAAAGTRLEARLTRRANSSSSIRPAQTEGRAARSRRDRGESGEIGRAAEAAEAARRREMAARSHHSCSRRICR